ncbi:MAG: YbjN domain-containing protein [Pseudomonadota bacterium]
MTDDFDSDDDGGEPIEILARYFDAHGWPNEPVGDDEVVTTVQGSWTSYELRGVWRSDDNVLQILLFPEIKMVEERRSEMFETLSLINEQLWMGHFEHWSASGIILYRHASLLDDDIHLSLDMAETLVQTAIDECERFYPVFQFVLWGGKSPSEAIAAALIETRGEA